MSAEKISISLDSHLVGFLSRYQKAHAIRSRSEVVASALHLLEQAEARASYRGMLEELEASDDLAVWDGAVSDGLPAEPHGDWWA